MITVSKFNLIIQLLILILLTFFFTSKFCGPDNLLYNEFLTGEQEWSSFNTFFLFFIQITNLFSFEAALVIHKIILFFLIFFTWKITKNSNITALFIILTIHHIGFTRSDLSFLLLALFFITEISKNLKFERKLFIQAIIIFFSVSTHFVSYLVLFIYFTLKLSLSFITYFEIKINKFLGFIILLILTFSLINYYDRVLFILLEFEIFDRLSGYIEGGKARRISQSIAASTYLVFFTYISNLIILYYFSNKIKDPSEKNNLNLFMLFYFVIFVLIIADYGSFSRLSPLLFITTLCIYYLISRKLNSIFLNIYIFVFFGSRAIWIISKPYMMNCFITNIYNDSYYLR